MYFLLPLFQDDSTCRCRFSFKVINNGYERKPADKYCTVPCSGGPFRPGCFGLDEGERVTAVFDVSSKCPWLGDGWSSAPPKKFLNQTLFFVFFLGAELISESLRSSRETIVKRRKLQWYGHVSRSSDLAKTILQGTVKRGRRQGGDKGRGWKTTLGNGQAWSSASPRGQWRTGKNGENWLQNHQWCPNDPRGQGIDDNDGMRQLFPGLPFTYNFTSHQTFFCFASIRTF